MQLCKFWVSQYGTHLPRRHWPRSRQLVPSFIGGDFGHSLDAPVQRDSCSQVAYCASRHFTPAGIYAQPWQQGEFLSLSEKRVILNTALISTKDSSKNKRNGYADPKCATYLQTAPWTRRSLQFLSQHESLSSVPKRPASHSSSPSTLKLPQNDSSGSEKQRPDLACRTFLMDRRLHGENLYGKKKLTL